MTESNYNLYAKLTLNCGTEVEIKQLHRGMNFNLTFTPKSGITVSDFADLKNGNLNVRVTEESLVGLYQVLRLMVEGEAKPKSFLEKLFEI